MLNQKDVFFKKVQYTQYRQLVPLPYKLQITFARSVVI